MAKKLSTSFYLSTRSKDLLKLIADADNRSQANMLEVIIEEAAKTRGIKHPDDKPLKK